MITNVLPPFYGSQCIFYSAIASQNVPAFDGERQMIMRIDSIHLYLFHTKQRLVKSKHKTMYT